MIIDGLKHYTAAGMNAGININAADITLFQEAINALPLTADTYNISYGRRAGLSSRYGMMPVPGHNSNEDGPLIAQGYMTGYSMRNLVAAEQTPAAHTTASVDVYGKRKFLYGAAVVQLPVGTGGKTVPVVYWISSRTAGANHQLDLCPSTAVTEVGQGMAITSELEAGVGSGSAVMSSFVASGKPFIAVDTLHSPKISLMRKLPDASTFQHYLNWAILQQSVETNIKEFAGFVIDAGVDPGTTPRDVYFYYYGCPFWISNKIEKKPISVDLALTGGGVNPKRWSAQGFYSSESGDLSADTLTSRATTAIAATPSLSATNTAPGRLKTASFSNVTYDVTGAFGTGTASYFCQVTDQPLVVPITIIAMVTDRPLIGLINPLIRDDFAINSTSTALSPPIGSNDFVQWVDPTYNYYSPRNINTINLTTGVGRYTEVNAAGASAVARQTCWRTAFPYVFGTVTSGVTVTAGGLLKAYTTYEYAYSIYNLLTGKESNVGTPARFFCTADNSAFELDFANFPLIETLFPECAPYSEACPQNFLYYRVYYRELGSAEWLFSGEYTFSRIYSAINDIEIFIGKTTAVGPVGGQPGFFNDYSDLPQDEYVDVTEFQGRLFWLSKGMLRYSRGDNAFTYPMRNCYPCPTGSFLGMKAHFFSGEAKQTGRLVVFGSDGHYVGQFTGILKEEQVRVSASAPPQPVPVEGSDFEISIRGSETAFSGRAAVVAEGVMYFFGPSGVFRDDGVQLPQRISQAIEPDYFEAYDQQKTGEFFAYFNKRSREVLFFYRPSTLNTDLNPNSYLTKAWVYSLRTEQWSLSQESRMIGAWTQYGYNSLIDWAQDLEVQGFEEPSKAPGKRTLIGVRRDSNATVSRPYYHDDDCPGGDYRPGDEMMVKEVQKPDSTTLRLVLASGYSSTILSAMTTATKFAVVGSVTYGGLSSSANLDGIYLPKAINAGAGTIDIAISGALSGVSAQAFDLAEYFPVFVQGYHDVECVIDTNYLAPEGLFSWNQVRYLHALIKPVPQGNGAGEANVELQWQANHEIDGATTASKTVSLFPRNSRETTTQLLVDIPSPGMQALAQAVKTRLTYNQVSGRWTLYLMTHYYEGRGDRELLHYQQANG